MKTIILLVALMFSLNIVAQRKSQQEIQVDSVEIYHSKIIGLKYATTYSGPEAKKVLDSLFNTKKELNKLIVVFYLKDKRMPYAFPVFRIIEDIYDFKKFRKL